MARITVLSQINEILESDDPKKRIRACIGIRVLGKLRPLHIEELLKRLSSLLPCENSVHSEFISYALAKFSRGKYLKDPGFISVELDRCKDWLSEPSETYMPSNSLNLLNWLAQFASSILLISSQHFLDALQVGVFHYQLNVRECAGKIISLFLERSKKGPRILTLYQAALHFIGSEYAEECHGSLIVLNAYAIHHPNLFANDSANLMQICRKYMTHSQKFIQMSALKLLIVLAPLNPLVFRNDHRDEVTAALWNDPRPPQEIVTCIIKLLENLPDVFENNDHRLLSIMRGLFSVHDTESPALGFDLLNAFYTSIPSAFKTRLVEVSGIILSAPFTADFLRTVPPLLHSSDALWQLVEKNLVKKIIDSLQSENPEIVLQVIAVVPSFSQQYSEPLLELTRPLLNSTNPQIRKYTPGALFALSSDIHSESYEKMLHDVLALAVSETAVSVRHAILESIQPPYSPYLCHPEALNLFSVLVNDDSFRVRSTTLRILGAIAHSSPSLILPIFRRVMLDALFICDSSPLLKLQAQTTRCFPIIIKACEPILPVYVHAFIPIATTYLKQRFSLGPNVDAKARGHQMTRFEQDYTMLISVNFIESIALMCKMQRKLLEPQFKEIADLLIDILEMNTAKDIAVSALNALAIIIDYMGTSAITTFPNLLKTLFDIGSGTPSWKVHAAIFKVYGRLGASAPDETDSRIILNQEEQKNYDMSFIDGTIDCRLWTKYVVASSLLWLLEDDLKSMLHLQALQALTDTFDDDSLILRPLFDRFINTLFQQTQSAAGDEKEHYFVLLKNNVTKHPDWMKQYASQFVKLLEELRSTQFFIAALDIIPELANKLEESFAPYLPRLVTSLLDILFDSESSCPKLAQKILISLTNLSTFGNDFVFIVMRQIVEVLFNPTSQDCIIITGLQSLQSLVMRYDTSTYSSLMIRACFQCFQSSNEEVRLEAVRLMKTISGRMGPSFNVYKSRATIQLNACKLMTPDIELALQDDYITMPEVTEEKDCEEEPSESESRGRDSNLDNFAIIQAVQCESTFTASQWKDWARSFAIALITQSPSRTVRRCAPLAQSYALFAFKILRTSFLSCWMNMSSSTRWIVCKSIDTALLNEETPMIVLTTWTTLAEFMEKTENHLNISYGDLAKAALRAEKLPFAMFCAQKDLVTSTMSVNSVEMVLQIYSQLALEDDLHGLIHSLRSKNNLEMTPKFAAQLGDWKTAITLFKEDIANNESFMGILESYKMIGDWKSIVSEFPRFDNLPMPIKSSCAQIFAEAFYHFNDTENFNTVIKFCPWDSIYAITTHCLMNHKLGISNDDLIKIGFDALGHRAGSLFPHGFSSMVPFLIQAQQLVELGEEPCKEVWSQRIKLPTLSFQQLQPLILMRIELLGSAKAESEILTLLKLSRNANEWDLYDSFFKQFFPAFDVKKSNPSVVFEHAISLWKRQSKQDASRVMEILIKRLKEVDDPVLTERVLYCKARWIIRTDGSENDETQLKHAAIVSKRAGNSKKTLLFWAWTQLRLYNMKSAGREQVAINAITAFIKCAEGISEMMQLCSLVFRAGKFPKVFKAVNKQLESLSTDLWIPMIPQLFAQYNNSVDYLQEFAHRTIWKCLVEHHHAVIFSQLFCISINDNGSQKAKQMLAEFAKLRPDVVETASTIFGGLMSACTTRAEFWLDSLNNAAEMLKAGKPVEMRAILDRVFNTLKQVNCDADLYFNKLLGDRISALQPFLKRFYVTKNKRDLDPMWAEYRAICNELKQEIDAMASIPMRFVAPRLSMLTDIPIAVPGTYDPSEKIVTMAKFAPSLDVFPSKQRPKRIAIIGSDGHEFWYLLKGKEDLRLDQRVVQVFHLINTFIPANMPAIITNFIMPLTPFVGLIQWIPGSDTLFKLIRDYRSARKIPLDTETRVITSLTTQRFDDLRPIQRLEALKAATEQTSDSVLSDILWLKAPDTESWVKRVTTFSRTSATMSVIGYILGLGDRHPSNLMIHKFTGSVIHVDFGDCFETTKERVLFPELIPFRLTRFMIRAFGPMGVDGSFRKTCQDIVKLIRRKREEVMSVLEIFAHAPIVYTEVVRANRNQELGTPSGISTAADIQRSISRIADKINGKDFGSAVRLTQSDQVGEMINSATDMYHLAHLYHGWNPLW